MRPSCFSHPGLIGYWPLAEDGRDHSGHERHGVIHGGGPRRGRFNGRSSYVEIPSDPGLELGRGDFAIAAWVKADDAGRGTIGDVIGQWDTDARKGYGICVKGSCGGYNGHSSERNLHFGTDDADLGEWTDCGRPNRTSNYVSNSLTVFNGSLYAATTDASVPTRLGALMAPQPGTGLYCSEGS